MHKILLASSFMHDLVAAEAVIQNI